MTICRQWAWKPNDDMKSFKQCIQTLVRVVGGDGNLLFNVGPMPDGRVEPRQGARLRQMGAGRGKGRGRAVGEWLGGAEETIADWDGVELDADKEAGGREHYACIARETARALEATRADLTAEAPASRAGTCGGPRSRCSSDRQIVPR